MLWLVAATTGVLARGGRVGRLGRVIVMATLFSPLVTTGGMSAEALGFALASTLLLLAAGRISRETVELLRRARHDADHDPLTGVLAPRAFRAEVDRLSGLASARPPDRAAWRSTSTASGPSNKRLGHAVGDQGAGRRRGDVRGGASRGRRAGAAAAGTSSPPSYSPTTPTGSRGASSPRSWSARRAARPAPAWPPRPRDGTGAEALLAAADVALRVAKRSSPGTVGVYDGMPISKGADGARAALERPEQRRWHLDGGTADRGRQGRQRARLRGARPLLDARGGGAAPLVRARRRVRPARRAGAVLPARGPRSRARAAEGRAAEREPVGAAARWTRGPPRSSTAAPPPTS